MQKLMREMENWRQSMLKAAGYSDAQIAGRVSQGGYPPEEEDLELPPPPITSSPQVANENDLPIPDFKPVSPEAMLPTVAPALDVDMEAPELDITPGPGVGPAVGYPTTTGLAFTGNPAGTAQITNPAFGSNLPSDTTGPMPVPKAPASGGRFTQYGRVAQYDSKGNMIGYKNPVTGEITPPDRGDTTLSGPVPGTPEALPALPPGTIPVNNPRDYPEYGLDPNGEYVMKIERNPDTGRTGHVIYDKKTHQPVGEASSESLKKDQDRRIDTGNALADARNRRAQQENQSVHPGESLITTGPNKGVITRGANPQTPVAKNVNGERQDLTKEDLDNFIQNDFKSEAEALGLPDGTGLPDHGFIPNPIPQTPVNTNPTNWRSIGAGSAIGAGTGGLLGGGLGYMLGGKKNKTLSTLLGAGLGAGSGALLGGLGGNYFGNKAK